MLPPGRLLKRKCCTLHLPLPFQRNRWWGPACSRQHPGGMQNQTEGASHTTHSPTRFSSAQPFVVEKNSYVVQPLVFGSLQKLPRPNCNRGVIRGTGPGLPRPIRPPCNFSAVECYCVLRLEDCSYCYPQPSSPVSLGMELYPLRLNQLISNMRILLAVL